jgi:hypothetical protein
MHDLVTQSKPAHYYGDVVRALFLAACVVMLVGLPAFLGYTRVPTLVSVLAVLLLGCAAGLTNPNQFRTAVLNAVLSVVGFVVFEAFAVIAYGSTESFLFLAANVCLGFIFIAAVYYSVKTVRGAYMRE